MTRWGAVDYTDVSGVRGPLMVVQRVRDVGLGRVRHRARRW